jgi:hypothetical protein
MQHTQVTEGNKVVKTLKGEATKYGCIRTKYIYIVATVNWMLLGENTKVDK